MSQVSEWLHDEGVSIKEYIIGLGRWEAIEWGRIHAWIDAVVLHHASAAAGPAPAPAPAPVPAPVEHVVLETPPGTQIP